MKNNWFCPNCGQPMEAQRHVDNSTGRITWTIGCLNPKHFHTHGYMNAAIAETAETYDLTLVDIYGLTKDHPEWFLDDGIHLTDEGASAVADAVAEAVLTD